MAWIKTSDAMPPYLGEGEQISVSILFAFATLTPVTEQKIWHIYEGWYNYDTESWETISSDVMTFERERITHWMAIPPIEE